MKSYPLGQRNLYNTYRREILLILVVKLMLVMALKYAFFSDPVSKTLTPETVSEAIIGLNPNPPSSTLPLRSNQ